MESNKGAFAEYVTSTAFSLTLSRVMCESIEWLLRKEMLAGVMHRLGTIPDLRTLLSLQRRGLAVPRIKFQETRTMFPSGWTLTEEGKLVYPLLVAAGLATPVDVIKQEMEILIASQKGEARG